MRSARYERDERDHRRSVSWRQPRQHCHRETLTGSRGQVRLHRTRHVSLPVTSRTAATCPACVEWAQHAPGASASCPTGRRATTSGTCCYCRAPPTHQPPHLLLMTNVDPPHRPSQAGRQTAVAAPLPLPQLVLALPLVPPEQQPGPAPYPHPRTPPAQAEPYSSTVRAVPFVD